ncbi:hypothetical protein QAD02_009269 [Eretmocerus hayati]|uniref:Uncharacterized protein n=1 Tax=Eretmocerus hayati TaxID=131215 RepID=A0ACC2N9M0_9HYME|nr:hypothetical protein QAD02_009269 [Eretmocerus hayati]
MKRMGGLERKLSKKDRKSAECGGDNANCSKMTHGMHHRDHDPRTADQGGTGDFVLDQDDDIATSGGDHGCAAQGGRRTHQHPGVDPDEGTHDRSEHVQTRMDSEGTQFAYCAQAKR